MQKTHPSKKFYGILPRPLPSGAVEIAKDDPNSSRKYRRQQFKLSKKVGK